MIFPSNDYGTFTESNTVKIYHTNFQVDLLKTKINSFSMINLKYNEKNKKDIEP